MQWADRVGRRVKLQDLHIVMVVTEERSMSNAARRLNTVQPAVSRAITDLERTLGVELFQRSARGVMATRYGKALAECGQSVFADLRKGLKTLETLADPTFGEVRLCGTEPIVTGLVPPVFKRLSRRYPGISVRYDHASARAQQTTLLRERRVDMILVRLPNEVDEDLVAEQLYVERSLVIAGASSRWAKRRKIDLADLMEEPWALPPPDTHVGTIFAEGFARAGFAYPSRNVAYGAALLDITLAASGQFIAIAPASMLRNNLFAGTVKVLPVTSPIPPWPVGVITHRGTPLSAAAELFVQIAREVTAERHRPKRADNARSR